MMNDWITRSSPEYMELREKAMEALERIDHMMNTLTLLSLYGNLFNSK